MNIDISLSDLDLDECGECGTVHSHRQNCPTCALAATVGRTVEDVSSVHDYNRKLEWK